MTEHEVFAESGAGDAGPSVVAGYRLLRRIASGSRIDAFLATADRMEEAGTERLVVLRVYRPEVDAAAIGTEIEAMTTARDALLPELLDVAALGDGRICVAVERIGGGVLARMLEQRRLEPGEAVTVLAPLLLAIGALLETGFVHTRLTTADVLFDDRGRPRIGGLGALRKLDGARSGVERTALVREGFHAYAGLLDEVLAAVPGGERCEATGLLRAGLAERPFTPPIAAVERALFEWADPLPLGGILRARWSGATQRIDPAGAFRFEPAPSELSHAEPLHSPGIGASSLGRGLLGLLAVPPGLTDRLASRADTTSTSGWGRRLLARLGGKRRPLVVALLVGVAALVLVLTVVPPEGSGAADRAESSSAHPRPTGTPTIGAEPTEPTTGPTADGGTDQRSSGEPPTGEPGVERDTATDPAEAARHLLAERQRCLDELSIECLSTVVQPGSALEGSDRAAVVAAQQGVAGESGPGELDLDGVAVSGEMGEAALLTVPWVEPERRPASLLMVRSEAGWRLRELFE